MLCFNVINLLLSIILQSVVFVTRCDCDAYCLLKGALIITMIFYKKPTLDKFKKDTLINYINARHSWYWPMILRNLRLPRGGDHFERKLPLTGL